MTPSIVLISSSSDEDNDDDDQSNSDEEEEELESENDSVYSESDDPDYNNDDVENSDEEECFHDSDDNEVCHRQGSNDSLELSLDECKEYLRKHQLRLSGTKEECIQRIKEHGRLKDGRGELLYPRSSFSINCTGDACKGDVVLFRQTTHKKQGNIAGERTVAGRIVNESYGPSKQQHTFTVLVAAFLNRSHVSNSNPQMFHGNENEHWNNIPMTNETLSLSHTDRFRFLDKACIRKQEGNNSNAKESPWRLCTVNQVEQVKILISVIPVFVCTIVFNTILVQLQGSVMNNEITKSFPIPPASLQAIPYILLIFVVPLYDYFFVPFARKITGHDFGITPLQRIGVGLFVATYPTPP